MSLMAAGRLAESSPVESNLSHSLTHSLIITLQKQIVSFILLDFFKQWDKGNKW
jgi:hypothetical protein